MQLVRSFRFSVGLVLLSLFACAGAEHGSPSPSASTEKAIDALANLSSERLTVADRVAASKWGTDKPIEDPPREKQVLDDMAKRALEQGVDGEDVQRIFRDQIEANKQVQRGLHERWQAAPDTAPTTRPDLAKEVRPVLDRIGGDLLTAIRDAQPVLAGPECRSSVQRAKSRIAAGLDELHQKGLERALEHACR